MAQSNMLIDPYDMTPPEDDTIFMNDLGTCIMSRVTLAKIATGEIPMKWDRLLNLDEMEEINSLMIETPEHEEDERREKEFKGEEPILIPTDCPTRHGETAVCNECKRYWRCPWNENVGVRKE